MDLPEYIFYTPLVLSDSDGRRVATAFICTMPFQVAQDDDLELTHAYLVTALHCVLDARSGQYRNLRVEMPWMEEQPLAVCDLPADNWVHFTMDEMPPGEDWVDVAVQPLTVDAYHGRVLGRATNAVRLDQLASKVEAGYDNPLIGAETTSVGLFHYYRGSADHVEPIPRYGRLLHVPLLPVDGAEGKMRAYLVESLASSGMSGSPVFVDGDRFGADEPVLLGLHVGHAREHSGGGHAGVSLVAPSWKLRALLDMDRLESGRRAVEANFTRSPWRFRDRRYRQRKGVAFKETHYLDLADYEEEHPFRHEYLFANVRDDAQDPEIYMVTDYWNEWAIREPLGDVARVKETLVTEIASLRWRSRYRDVMGWGELDDASEASVKLYLGESGAVDVVVIELERELDYSYLDRLTSQLGGNHYLICRRDEVNWIPGP